MLWLSTFFVLCTFAVLDAAAFAWSASLLSGYQLAGALLTVFLIEAGAVITLWRMRAR
jgi:hypothetical protein